MGKWRDLLGGEYLETDFLMDLERRERRERDDRENMKFSAGKIQERIEKRVGKREMDEMERSLTKRKVEKVRRYVSYTYSNFTEKRKNFDKEVEIDTKYKIKRMFDKLYANSSSKNKLGSNKRHEKCVYDLIQKPSCKRKIISNKKFDFSECLNLKKLISKEIEMMNNLKLNKTTIKGNKSVLEIKSRDNNMNELHSKIYGSHLSENLFKSFNELGESK